MVLVKQAGFEVRLGRILASFGDNLQKSAQGLLVAALLLKGFAVLVGRIVLLRRVRRLVVARATGQQDQDTKDKGKKPTKTTHWKRN